MKVVDTTTEQKFEAADGSEIIIKQRRKIDAYDGFINNPAEHLKRQGWDKSFNYPYPEDYGLGIETSIDRNKMPSQFQEIYNRFLDLGYIYEWGTHCVLMSSVLRRILRLHGFNAYTKQVICYWENEQKGQKAIIGVADGRGGGNPTQDGSIDAHMVVTCDGYILDFSLSPIHYRYGLVAPRALIGLDVIDDSYQDFGISGQAAWVDVKPQNPIIKHWRYEQKPVEMDLTRQYFRKYQF